MIHFTNINGERLPEDVNKIANERCDIKEECFKNKFRVNGAFYFDSQPEGYAIWFEVYHGNYEPLREFHRNNTEKPNS